MMLRASETNIAGYTASRSHVPEETLLHEHTHPIWFNLKSGSYSHVISKSAIGNLFPVSLELRSQMDISVNDKISFG